MIIENESVLFYFMNSFSLSSLSSQ